MRLVTRLTTTGQAPLTGVGAVRRDCKEKEELIQRVLESSARALLPDLELDEMVIADDDSGEGEADGSSGGEASEQSLEPPAAEDDGTQSTAEEEPGEAAEAGTAAPEEPEGLAEAEVSENWRTRAEAAAAAAAAAAAGTTAPVTEESKRAQSKVAQSKVLEGEGERSAGETAPEAPAAAAPATDAAAAAPAPAATDAAAAATDVAAAAAAPAAEYTKAQLMSDLGTVQMMGENGSGQSDDGGAHADHLRAGRRGPRWPNLPA